MALHFISGKPRGGKSLHAMRLVVEQLLHKSALIVTNLPVDLPALNEFLQIRYPDKTVVLKDRIRLLDEEQTSRFWEFRAETGPTFFVIDEIHLYFNARKWMKIGEECLEYISQHGKMSDTIIAVTQAVGNVDKQFRSIAQDFSKVENRYLKKFGWFRFGGCFRIEKFDTFTEGNSRKPFETQTFKFDQALADTYNTSAGHGISGEGERDKLQTAKGVPLKLLVGGFLVFAVGLGFLPGVVMKALAGEEEEPEIQEERRPKGGILADLIPRDYMEAASPLLPFMEQAKTERTRITLRMKLGGVWIVHLSDGRKVRSDRSGSLELVTEDGVQVDGEFYKF